MRFEIKRAKNVFQEVSVAFWMLRKGKVLNIQKQEALDVFMKHPKHFEANALFEKYLAEPPYMVLTHPI